MSIPCCLGAVVMETDHSVVLWCLGGLFCLKSSHLCSEETNFFTEKTTVDFIVMVLLQRRKVYVYKQQCFFPLNSNYSITFNLSNLFD